ncbi:MAG: DNA-directed RNA polymerase subunit beta [Clostridiales Family XIII bacterium]|jgi:DNA-directed RNA polymerase subunit beta|nr:DNA-directed RNA polymerase subunit beta [Clostridiales Family XIII bacterium]
MPQPVKFGKKERMNYSTIREVGEIPNLIQIQTQSYSWFIGEGLKEVFHDISPIDDFAGNLSLHFTDHKFNTPEDPPKFSEEECRDRDATYSAPLKVGVRLINKETGEIKEQEVFLGEFPLMTDKGTFICNGAERVVVTQLVRSPGPYFNEMDVKDKPETAKSVEKAHKAEAKAIDENAEDIKHYKAQIIPNRGAWLEYETDDNGVLYVRVDRTRKLPATVLIRALAQSSDGGGRIRNAAGISDELGLGTDEEIIQIFGADPLMMATLEKDTTDGYESAIVEIFKKVRPGDMPTAENAKRVFENLFFDPKRYDLAKVGRYKYNKKLGLSIRLTGHTLAKDVIDPATGEIIAETGQVIDRELALRIENTGVFSVTVSVQVPLKGYDAGLAASESYITRDVPIIGNRFVELKGFVNENVAAYCAEQGVPAKVHYPTLKRVLDAAEEKTGGKKKDANDILRAELVAAKTLLAPKHMLADDIFATFSFLVGLPYGIGSTDDIDHLGNRRVRTVGELLQNQFRIGLARMERAVRERMTIQDIESATPQQLLNIRPVTAAIKEFFGSSQLSQFMDQNNPLAELTHKRRLSALGPGGLSRERAGFDVRDVHYSHYGRMCPIETPEGPNIGLIGSLTTYGKVNEYGFIETPYRKVDKTKGVVTEQIDYLSADEEESLFIAQANEPLDEKGHFLNKRVAARHGIDIDLVPKELADYMDVSPKQVVSVATAMIPFLENDDANRALMGSNMQRQAVPLLVSEAPIVGTGMEFLAARDSGVVVLAKNGGTVDYVDAESIRIRKDDAAEGGKKKGAKAPGEEVDVYHLLKFKRSNQGTCINQRPIVNIGEHVEAGEVIADGPSTDEGEVALGKNLLIGFMTWEGYNYEDAIILNERLIMDDVLTSLHIEEYECEARDTKLGPEEITRDIPNIGDDARKDLDEEGIVRIGAEVTSYDILVGKVTPKGETELTAEERLLRAIFGEKAREVRDTSLKIPHGETGIVVDIKTFSRDGGDDLPPGVNKLVRVYVATKRKISVGDKMAGRHGNKGVISRVLPEEDMPFMEDGTPLQVMLNPLGVPSRMNVGQVLEVHLGLAAKKQGWYISTPVFDGAHEGDITKLLIEGGYPENGKLKLRDGRSGEAFDNPVTVGYMYMLKLHHLVDDKIHARSTGPYSLITQQPLGGKAQFGGQRFGEMEVWALEAYGAAYTLQEILTVKSDDIVGRVKTYEAIVKGDNIPEPSIPESFKVLIKEMQSLCLDVTVRDDQDKEIELKEFADLGASSAIERMISTDKLTPDDEPLLDLAELAKTADAEDDDEEEEEKDSLLDAEDLAELGVIPEDRLLLEIDKDEDDADLGVLVDVEPIDSEE